MHLPLQSSRLHIAFRRSPGRARPRPPALLAGLAILALLLSPAAPARAAFPPDGSTERIPLALAPSTLTPDPVVQNMLNQVQSSTLYALVSGLSGEQDITVGGAPFDLNTRSTNASTYIEKATQYTYEYFQSLGLVVSYHTWSYSGSPRRNVVAEQTGSDPNCLYLLTAHLDSTSPNALTSAPGADDNASGSAGVMVAADLLRQHRFTCTLRYVLFTGEEQGLLGSAAYAQQAANRGDPIRGVLNMDMIAYNTSGSNPTFQMDTRSGSAGVPDQALSSMVVDVTSAYQLGLTPLVYASNESASDHSSFWTYGYPAVLLIEDFNDFTPYYHRTSDRVNTLDMAYFTEFVKAVLGAAAHLANRVSGAPANSLPTSTDTSRTILEDTQATFAASDFPFSDADGGSSLQGIQLLSLPAAGTLYLDLNANNQVGSNETLAAGEALSLPNLARLKFKPATNANGDDYTSFTFKVFDGTDYSTAAGTFTIHVTPVNDAPSFTKGGNPSVVEDSGPQTLPGWVTRLSPGPANENAQALSFSITANSNPALFSAQPAVDPASGTLSFTPAPDAYGSASLSLRLSDDGGTANGGINSSSQAFTIQVTPVNDAPSFSLTDPATGSQVTAGEDAGPQALPAWAGQIAAGPENEATQTLSFTVAANSNPGLFSAGPVVDPASGALSFTPAADANGSASLSLVLKDGGGTANGGVDTSAAQAFTITITALNDAPTFTPVNAGNVSVPANSGAYTGTWATGLRPGPADESGQTVSAELAGIDKPGLFSAAPSLGLDGSTGLVTLSFTPVPGVAGVAHLSVIFTDSAGAASPAYAFTITVQQQVFLPVTMR